MLHFVRIVVERFQVRAGLDALGAARREGLDDVVKRTDAGLERDGCSAGRDAANGRQRKLLERIGHARLLASADSRTRANGGSGLGARLGSQFGEDVASDGRRDRRGQRICSANGRARRSDKRADRTRSATTGRCGLWRDNVWAVERVDCLGGRLHGLSAKRLQHWIDDAAYGKVARQQTAGRHRSASRAAS